MAWTKIPKDVTKSNNCKKNPLQMKLFHLKLQNIKLSFCILNMRFKILYKRTSYHIKENKTNMIDPQKNVHPHTHPQYVGPGQALTSATKSQDYRCLNQSPRPNRECQEGKIERQSALGHPPHMRHCPYGTELDWTMARKSHPSAVWGPISPLHPLPQIKSQIPL